MQMCLQYRLSFSMHTLTYCVQETFWRWHGDRKFDITFPHFKYSDFSYHTGKKQEHISCTILCILSCFSSKTINVTGIHLLSWEKIPAKTWQETEISCHIQKIPDKKEVSTISWFLDRKKSNNTFPVREGKQNIYYIWIYSPCCRKIFYVIGINFM